LLSFLGQGHKAAQKYHCHCAENKDFWPCGCNLSVGAPTQKDRATLEHNPGHLEILNVAIIDNSIVQGFKYPPTILPNLVMNSSALRGA
jgi:hypothetical protein